MTLRERWRWLRTGGISRWYAKRYVCPFWDHKPEDLGEYRGQFDRAIGMFPRCANCGEVIPGGGTPGRTTR